MWVAGIVSVCVLLVAHLWTLRRFRRRKQEILEFVAHQHQIYLAEKASGSALTRKGFRLWLLLSAGVRIPEKFKGGVLAEEVRRHQCEDTHRERE